MWLTFCCRHSVQDLTLELLRPGGLASMSGVDDVEANSESKETKAEDGDKYEVTGWQAAGKYGH